MNKIKILIVDDSVLFRSQIQLALKDCDQVEIVGTASNGKIALDKLSQHDTDLMILDLEMPVLDGISTVKEMRNKKSDTKVILFSSMSQSGAEKTLEAMNLGALDFVAKPMPDETNLAPHEKIRSSLLPKILSLFPSTVIPGGISKSLVKSNISWDIFKPDILVIASSTGGPNALSEFFQHLTEPVPFPILVTQHMPPVFTTSLAQRLGEIAKKTSGEGVSGEILKANQIYVAPGNFHMSIAGTRIQQTIMLDQGPARNFVRPCADFLLESASGIFKKNTLGIVLTGMGRDGADGCQRIKSNGGAVLIQDQASSVVFGMPGAVFDAGQYDYIGIPADLGRKVAQLARTRRAFNVA
jgi:two-component system, chemotaxis family, protein-glutamate methylesterase/glutaminase